MKNLGLLIVASMLSFSAFAQVPVRPPRPTVPPINRPPRPLPGHHDTQEARVVKLAEAVARAARLNADTLSPRDLGHVLNNLRRAKALLEGRPLPPGPGPIGPGPGPIGPHPGPHPRPALVCSQEPSAIMYSTFQKIKSLAFSSSGMDMSDGGATRFAQSWVDKYPCSAADEYARDFKRLKDFAYSSRYLDQSSSQSINFAKEKVDSFCTGYNLETEFQRHYDFAYSARGLDYSKTRAKQYAFDQVQPLAFSCRRFF